MKRLLLISYLYAPISVIGAIRWTKLSKYLTELGYEVDVITTSSKAPDDSLLSRDIQNVHKVFRIDHINDKFASTVYARSASAPAAARKNGGVYSTVKRIVFGSRALTWMLRLRNLHRDWNRGADFAKAAESYIKANLDINKYDAVVSTYGPIGNIMLALKLKKAFPSARIIADFRDPMSVRIFPLPIRLRNRRLERRICSAASGISCVSAGVSKKIRKGAYQGNIEIIPNGYDLDDRAKGIEPEGFSFCYTGSMYDGKSNLRPLFSAIRTLIDESSIPESDVKFEYAGSGGRFVLEQAAQYGLSQIVKDNGQIDRSDALKLQQSCRFLVLSSWNNRGNEGVLTGKFLEYMSAGRPVIALVSGNKGGSEIRSIIERAGLGTVWEEPTGAEDSNTLCNFIKASYDLYLSKQDNLPRLDGEYIADFGYDRLAGRMAEFIEQSIAAE